MAEPFLLRLNPGDTDPDAGRLRAAVRRARPLLTATSLTASTALLAVALHAPGRTRAGAWPDPVLALAVQGAIGAAATPALAAPGGSRRSRAAEWLVAVAALGVLAATFVTLAGRRGARTATLQLALQAAVQLVPQAAGSALRAPRVLGDPAAGTRAAELRELVRTPPGRLETVEARRLVAGPAGLELHVDEARWTVRGRSASTAVHPLGQVLAARPRGRRAGAHVEVEFADGSRLGLRAPGAHRRLLSTLRAARPAGVPTTVQEQR